jgi:hypothetical protein
MRLREMEVGRIADVRLIQKSAGIIQLTAEFVRRDVMSRARVCDLCESVRSGTMHADLTTSCREVSRMAAACQDRQDGAAEHRSSDPVRHA